MINTVKKRIREYVSIEIQKSLLKNHQQTGQPPWNDLIAINPDYKEFKPLRDVSHYRDGKTEIDPHGIGLETDLDHYIAKDPYPLPATEDREGYMDDRHFEFWLFGLSDYIKIKKSLEKFGHPIRCGYRIYDMGCASGRVIRHFLCQEDDLDLWASDINRNHVEWIFQYLQGVKAFQNSSIPHLPFEDNFFDVVYAFSVFTHIDAFETAWLMELRRILKPGGIAYLTTHSEHTWSIMNENMPLYRAMVTHPDFSPDLLKSDLPRKRMVYRWHTGSYGANVFYDSKHIYNIWGKYFKILDVVREGCFYQDAVLLRKEPFQENVRVGSGFGSLRSA